MEISKIGTYIYVNLLGCHKTWIWITGNIQTSFPRMFIYQFTSVYHGSLWKTNMVIIGIHPSFSFVFKNTSSFIVLFPASYVWLRKENGECLQTAIHPNKTLDRKHRKTMGLNGWKNHSISHNKNKQKTKHPRELMEWPPKFPHICSALRLQTIPPGEDFEKVGVRKRNQIVETREYEITLKSTLGYCHVLSAYKYLYIRSFWYSNT